MKTAYFNAKMKTLTLFVSRNTTETVNCPNLATAKHKAKQTGIEQQIIKK